MGKNIAKSCSLKDVQAAIATAKAGDTVGGAEWDSDLGKSAIYYQGDNIEGCECRWSDNYCWVWGRIGVVIIFL